MHVRHNRISIALILLAATPSAMGEVILYSNKNDWQTAAGSYSSITFTELPAFTWITDQYQSIGVTFTDGSDQVDTSSNAYIDGFGLNGAFDESTLQFATPIATIAFDFPGTMKASLFYKGTHIYTSPFLGIGGVGNFGGLVSTEPFDEALLWDPGSGLFIDNIHFGPPIPAPGALTLLALGFTLRGRRRRASA